jgi:hypothetical protein
MAPGFEDEVALKKSKSAETYWAKGKKPKSAAE